MSASDVILRLLVIGLCFCGAGFFAGMEIGVISINRLRLHHLVQRGLRGASVLERFLQHPERLLSTTLVGTNLAQTMFAILLTSLLMRTGWPHAAMAANVSGTLVLLVFAEYLPKAWFQAHPIPHTLPFARLLAASARALSPLSWVVERMVRVMIGRKTSDQPTTPLLTREDLIHLTTEGRRDGALTPFESRMIQGVFALSGTRCRDIMAPMDRIIRIEADLPASDLITIARAREVNRFPVYDPARRKYIGIVHIFDVLADESAAGKTARDYMRPPQFVAEHMLVDHVLPRMRATRQPLTLVTDAHYEVIGLITLNDVLRVIVGDEP